MDVWIDHDRSLSPIEAVSIDHTKYGTGYIPKVCEMALLA